MERARSDLSRQLRPADQRPPGRVDRALGIFDQVIVGGGRQSGQAPALFTVAERVAMISEVLAGRERASVESYRGLTVDFARSKGRGRW